VEADRVFESGERTVMEKRGLQGHVPERRGAEHVTVVRVARHLLEPEVFVLPGPVEGHITSRGVAYRRRDLRPADNVRSEVAKHFIRLPRYGVASDAIGAAEEEERAVVMACTEIPLVLRPEDVEIPLLDSTRLLAKAALKEALAVKVDKYVRRFVV